MNEFCKFPRDISCRDIDDLVKLWRNVFPNTFGGVIRRGASLGILEKTSSTSIY